MCVTTGARRSVITTTCMPLRRVKVSGVANALAGGALAVEAPKATAPSARQSRPALIQRAKR
jgi:hypothetical protein